MQKKKTNRHVFARLLLLVLAASSLLSLISCEETYHHDGAMLFYTSEKSDLYIIYQKDLQNHLVYSKLSPLSEKWRRNISGHPTAPSVKIFENMIACNCRKGYVCLLDKENGKTLFSAESKLVFSTDSIGFTVEDGNVYTLCGENSVCSFDIESGEKRWETEISESMSIVTELKIEDEMLFYGTSTGEITAIDKNCGEIKWKAAGLNELADFYTFPDTLLVDYENVNGFSTATGENQWLVPYQGKVRCINDGFVIAQSNDFFSVLFLKNGMEHWNYPRTGTTILSCNEGSSYVAFTVRSLEPSYDSADVPDYFDKVYIFDVSSGEKVFDYNSGEGIKVINITGFSGEKFYVAAKVEENSVKMISVEKYSLNSWEKEAAYSFPEEENDSEIFVALVYSDSEYTVFKKTNILSSNEFSFYLFETESGELLGKMSGFPEAIYGGKAYDIINYDDYFNVEETTLPGFLEKK